MPGYDRVAVLLQSRLDIVDLPARRGERNSIVGEVVAVYAGPERPVGNGLDEVNDSQVDVLDLGRNDHAVERPSHRDVLVGVDTDGHRAVRARGLEHADAGTAGNLKDHIGAGVVERAGGRPRRVGIGEVATVRVGGQVFRVDVDARALCLGTGQVAGAKP